MRFTRSALVFLALLTVTGSAQTPVTGTWKIETVSWREYLMADFEVVLDLKADGKTLTGTAHMSTGEMKWPGDAQVSDGVIDGDHISFTIVGTIPSSSGPPKMVFDGIIQGDTLRLAMTYGYVYRASDPVTHRGVVEAKRFSN